MKQQGILKKITSKRLGRNTFYSFFLEGDDNMYRTAFDPIAAEEGDFVSFDYEKDKYGLQVAVNTVEKQAGAPQEEAKPKSRRGGGSGGKDDYWAKKEAGDVDRQNSIVLQSSTKDAIAIVGLALQHDAIVLGSKKADKLDLIMNMVYEKAEELFLNYINATEYRTSLEVQDNPVAQPESGVSDE